MIVFACIALVGCAAGLLIAVLELEYAMHGGHSWEED